MLNKKRSQHPSISSTNHHPERKPASGEAAHTQLQNRNQHFFFLKSAIEKERESKNHLN